MCDSSRSVELRLQLPDSLLDHYRYSDLEDAWWWTDICDNFFEGFEDQTGLYAGAYDHGNKRYTVDFDMDYRQCYFPCGVYNWPKFLEANGLTDQFPTILRYHEHGAGNALEMTMERVNYGRSCYKAHLDVSDHSVGWDWNDDLDETTIELLNDWLTQETKALAEIVEDKITDQYDQLLAELAAEAEWLTSDEHLTNFFQEHWELDELVTWCLDHDEPVVWLSTPC